MPTQRDIIDDIKDLNREVCRRLWHMAGVGDLPKALAPHLVYPNYRSQARRVSEQEARFAYAEVLSTSVYYYSVETPTEEQYKVTGTKEMSARSDMSLYMPGEDGLAKVANVELKKGNPPPAHIEKDIEKLIRESLKGRALNGNWFHLLDNTDSGTFTALFGKFRKAFAQIAHHLNAQDVGNLSVVMCFCVLGDKPDGPWACLKHFGCPNDSASYGAYWPGFLDLDSDQGLKESLKAAGWEICCASNG